MTRRISTTLTAAVLALGLTPVVQGTAQAAEVVIGVLYPLTGPVAQVGIDAVAAVKTAVDIINEDVNLNVPLGPGKGLTNLGGAKIRLVIADHGGKPDVGQAEAERMITQEKVHALFGAYYSSVTKTASQVAERYQIPFLNAESTSPGLTKRGFKWFFRTTPHDGEFTKLMYEFMKDFQKKKGIKLKTVAILHEDSEWGTGSGKVQQSMADSGGYKVVENIAYKKTTTSMTSEVQRIKAASPDVFLPSSYTSDAMLFLRTAKELDYNPKLVIAQNAGYTDPTFLKQMGADAEGAITRNPYNDDLAKTIPLISKINARFKKYSKGRDLSDVPVRAFTGFLALADAINRAGSTDPEKIRKALVATDIPPEKLIVPWRGIKFGSDGHNLLSRGILQQVQNGKYCTIYPFEVASCDVVYPMPTWKEKAAMK